MATWQKLATYSVRVNFEEDPDVHTFLYSLGGRYGEQIRQIIRDHLHRTNHEALRPEVQEKVFFEGVSQLLHSRRVRPAASGLAMTGTPVAASPPPAAPKRSSRSAASLTSDDDGE